MDTIHVQLYSHEEYKKDEAANLIFEVSNPSKKPIRLLKWNTPLEGLRSDCLDVKRNGKSVHYDGIMVKRGAPTPDDFITIEPGQSVSKKVDLGEAYDMSTPGHVKVDYKKEGLRVTGDADKKIPANQKMGAAGKMTAMAFTASLKRPGSQVKVVTKKADFKITGGTTKRLPAGARERALQASKKPPSANLKTTLSKTALSKKAKAAVTGPYPCLLTGGTAAQKLIVKKAHENGYQLVLDVLTSMKNNRPYKTWFGAYSKGRFGKVKTDYQKIRSEYENKQFTYDLTGTSKDCRGNTYAFTYQGGDTISLCSAFWAAPDTGDDSRAGTLVHERSHASAFTDDLAYGKPDCLTLAKKTPAKAINNADTHEYYAKG
ncbi:M35 family metallopeptidase [Flavitalea flava]